MSSNKNKHLTRKFKISLRAMIFVQIFFSSDVILKAVIFYWNVAIP